VSTEVNVANLVFDVLEAIKHPEIVPLGSAFPSPEHFPTDRLNKAAADAARRLPVWSSVRDLPPGNVELRRLIALRYAEAGVDIAPDDIVITCGAMEAINLSLNAVAKPGDIICVTGDLGAAYLGLQILEREKQVYLAAPDMQPELSDKKYLIGRQLKPEARLESVRYFEKTGLLPTSMIDISDGLASDLLHICKASGTGAFIEESQVPIHDEARAQAIEFRLDPITCALNGGEDYELLFTVSPADLEKVRFMDSVYIIGEITPKEDGITLHSSGGQILPISAQGWKHF